MHVLLRSSTNLTSNILWETQSIFSRRNFKMGYTYVLTIELFVHFNYGFYGYMHG